MGALEINSAIFERRYRDSGIPPRGNQAGPLPKKTIKGHSGGTGRVASRMNCRYRAPVPFTPLVATVLLASQSIGSRCA
jgi:hypothetical protein